MLKTHFALHYTLMTFNRQMIKNHSNIWFALQVATERESKTNTSEKVQVGNDQEKAQTEKKIPTPKTEVEKNLINNQVKKN